LFLAAAAAFVASLIFLAAFVLGMLGASPALAVLAGAFGGLLFATSLVCFVLARTRAAL
jgi:hypothetical protein